jgi:hypothetical protein
LLEFLIVIAIVVALDFFALFLVKYETMKIKSDNLTRSKREKSNIAVAILEKESI